MLKILTLICVFIAISDALGFNSTLLIQLSAKAYEETGSETEGATWSETGSETGSEMESLLFEDETFEISEYTYFIYLEKNQLILCNGVLVSDLFGITSESCGCQFPARYDDRYKAKIGSDSTCQVERGINNMIPYSSYKTSNFIDITLIRLVHSVPNSIGFIKWKEEVECNTYVFVPGWTRQRDGSILSMEERSWTTIDMENYCEYFGKIHMNGMSGLSGSPLISGIGTNELVGIVSWPHPESNEVLFTPIFCVLDFLETFVNLH